MNEITKVEMIDAETGKEEVLYERDNKKRIRFMKMFRYKNYEIQLRLDYNFKPTVPPILDADIRDLSTNEFLPKNSFQHNTPKKHDPILNMDIYDFSFAGLTLRLFTRTTATAEQHISFTVGKKTA
jgi:hypothetical protein